MAVGAGEGGRGGWRGWPGQQRVTAKAAVGVVEGRPRHAGAAGVAAVRRRRGAAAEAGGDDEGWSGISGGERRDRAGGGLGRAIAGPIT